MFPFCSLEGGASHVKSIVCDPDVEHRNINGLADGAEFQTNWDHFKLTSKNELLIIIKSL